ncbi:MAG: YfhO family protein [Ignavibacteria bacterium]|nr:YfhO family protein [Ignavibacteria bacterium]
MAKQNTKKQVAKKQLIPSKYQDLVAILSLIILVFGFFWGAITGGGFIDFDNLSSLSFRPFIEEATKSGNFPLWIPLIFSGMPAYASLLVTGSRSWDIIAQIFTNISVGFGGIFGSDVARVLFFYILYGIGIYWLLRYKKFEKTIAIFSAFAAVFSTYVITWIMIGHNTKPIVLAMFPYVFLFIEKLKEKFSFLNFGLLIIAFAVMFIGNHLQMIFYGGLAFAIYIIYDFVAGIVKKEKIIPKLRTALLTGIALGIAFLMSADRYFSTFEYAPYSVRGAAPIAKIHTDKTQKADKSDYDYATMWSYHPKELFTFIVPSYFGFGIREYREGKASTYWGTKESEDSPPYMGIIVLALAIVGLIHFRKNIFVQALFVISIFGIFLSFGKNLPFLFDLFYHYFPSFSKFRAPSMSLVLVHFSVPILAAFGIKALNEMRQNSSQNKKTIKWLIVLPLLFLVVTFFFSAFMKSTYISAVGSSETFQSYAKAYGNEVVSELQEFVWSKTIQDFYINAIFLVAFGIFAALYIQTKVQYATLITIFSLITVFDLFRIDSERMEYSKEGNATSIFEARRDVYDFIKRDTTIFRIADFSVNPANLTAYYLLENINGYHAAKLRVYQDLMDIANMEGMEGSTSQLYNPFLWNLLNVKYLIFNKTLEGVEPIYRGAGGQAFVYPNFGYYPRAFFVKTAIVEKPIEILNHLKKGSFNPIDTMFVEKPLAVKDIGYDTAAKVQIVEKKNEYIKFTTETNVKSLLFISEVYYPFWKAYIDGKETEIIKANYAFRSVVVPAGKHTLEMKFTSPGFERGKTLSLVANLLTFAIIGLGLYFDFKKKNKIK